MRVPILIYHSVGDSPDGAGLSPGYRLTVGQFESQLEVLKENEFVPISLRELLLWRQGAITLPERACVISFDDGYADNHHVVFPRLREFGFRAIFFISVSAIGAEGMMKWAEIEKLLASGMEIGSHGLRHDLLAGKKEDELRRELEESRRQLSARLQATIDFFALPRGYLPSALPALARRAGYCGMCTSIPGYNTVHTDPFAWRRFPVRSGFAIRHFRAIMFGEGRLLGRIMIAEKMRSYLRLRYGIFR